MRDFRKQKDVYNVDDKMVKEVSQRAGRCPIPGNTWGQVREGSGQPDLLEDELAQGRGVRLDDL